VISLPSLIREVPDFPKKGINFLDITPMLSDSKALKLAVVGMASSWVESGVTWVMASEARGFILGSAVAVELGAGFIPMRKPGKLPGEVESQPYTLEYGQDSLEVHVDPPFQKGKVLLLDDVLATGGTAAAMADLAVGMGADVVGFQFLLEIYSLKGRATIADMNVHSLLMYT